LSGQYQRSAYDSAYLALAQWQSVWFVTGDKRLFNAVGYVLSWVKWLGDYQFDTIPRLFKKFSPLNGKGFPQVIAVVHVVLEGHAADFKKSQETFRSPGPEVR
jgi:hypothetical protein